MVDRDDVERAAARLQGIARRTPVLTSHRLDGVFLKAECLQHTGSFKFRGATNAVAQLPPGTTGVCTVSSGNHAQALALAAAVKQVPATILMPFDAPAFKRAATRDYGADVVEFDRYAHPDRDQLLDELAAERGLHVVHPYDDWRVIAGQGTVALELLAAEPGLDALAVPVGGGGLIAGCATVARPQGVTVIGVEPEAGDDVRQSLQRGSRVTLDAVPRTIADGQQLTAPGRRPWEVIRQQVGAVVTVSDEEIRDAMRFALTALKLVLEPSGATALAAVIQRRVPGERIGVVLSGGNVDPDRYARLVSPPAG